MHCPVSSRLGRGRAVCYRVFSRFLNQAIWIANALATAGISEPSKARLRYQECFKERGAQQTGTRSQPFLHDYLSI